MDFDILWSLKVAPAAIIGLTVHEFFHAFTADCLGDSTARDQGRLTLNPLKQLDLVGFILIMVAGFGWAKPVQFDSNNLRNKHRDEILISLAGPFSNLVIAIVFFVLSRVMYLFEFFHNTDSGLAVVNLFILWGIINLGLFVFNLLPIPPLDGSHLYLTYMQEISPASSQKIYKFGTWALLIIIIIQNRTDITIIPVNNIVNVIADALIMLLRF